MGAKAFVTGGTGFVGSHLAEALLRRGYSEVRCLVRTRRKWLRGLPIVPVRGTLKDTTLIAEATCDVDVVFHLGGVTRAPSYALLRQGNVTATTQLLDVILASNTGLSKILITSSLAAVGRSDGTPADEETPLRPISQYGRSKAEMETALAPYHASLPLVVVRPPSVYGPRDRDVYTFFKAVQQGICPMLRGDPGLTLVHVSDLVRGMIEAAESDSTVGQTYFIGNDEAISWDCLKANTMQALGRRALTLRVPRSLVLPVAAVAETGGRLLGRYPPLNREKGQELLYATKRCVSGKAFRDFGYAARMSLSQGLAETIGWYRAEGWLR